MYNPIKALRDGGAWLADNAGKAAAKCPWPKNMSPGKKAKIAGVAATVVGFAVAWAAAEVALPALALGALFTWWGLFPPAGLYMLGAGVAAAATSTVGAGMIYGADKHCGILSAVVNKLDRLSDKIENAFTRTRAPSVTDGFVRAAPETSTFNADASAKPDFTKALEPAVAASVPAPQLRPALRGPSV